MIGRFKPSCFGLFRYSIRRMAVLSMLHAGFIHSDFVSTAIRDREHRNGEHRSLPGLWNDRRKDIYRKNNQQYDTLQQRSAARPQGQQDN